MTDLRDAAESATAGVPVQVAYDLENVKQFIQNARWAYVSNSEAFKHNFGYRLIDAVEVAASALDTARAEIERLRRELQEFRDSVGTDLLPWSVDGDSVFIDGPGPVAIDHGDKRLKRAETAESALTAAQERIAELEGAGAGVIKSWDDRQHGEIEQLKHSDEGGFDYWSPRASMVSSEAIAALRATLSPAVKEPK